MIGKDESNEEVIFKVNDRRKFNADGSLREGVEIPPEKPKEEIKPEQAKAETAPQLEESAEFENIEEAETGGEDELPGADDPASFVNFLSTLATNAAAALGA